METTKKQYTKPQLKTIELKAEEVLSTGCKLKTGGTPRLPTGSSCLVTMCGGTGS